MVIRIFYLAIAVFSVAMVILNMQAPYLRDFFKDEIIIANMEMNDIIDYELAQNVDMKIISDNGVRYNDRDEFKNFYGEMYASDTNHTLRSDIAIHKDGVLTFVGNVKYKNDDNLTYDTQELIYDTKSKIATSNKPYIATRNQDKVIGESLKYDLNTKQSFSKGVHAWVQTKNG